ncbi:DoxX family protein [Chryseobacterium sp. A301]
MNFLTSIHTHPRVNDFILLVVRLFIGFGMISHGFPKIMKLSSGEPIEFYNFLGLGSEFTLGLCVFVEVVCSIFVILGLFTRGALLFLIALTAVISFVVHGGDLFSDQEMGLLYLSIYLLLMAFGPGKYSIDGMITKKRASSAW